MAKRRKESQLDIRIRARMNLALVEASRTQGEAYEDLKLEAFMATFHPELQRDKTYMRDLKAATHDKS
ncbi:hypothetical protein LCGC14_2759120 [marine sediment metagenome]|uniref:Uncharacterized protein n=1 Tax=marine sediment metagenome TaxID=412755 RepID=A0A0F8YZI5_9ZZZZ